MNPYNIHRHKDIFGEDASEFRPERWLDTDTKHMDRAMFQVCETFYGYRALS